MTKPLVISHGAYDEFIMEIKIHDCNQVLQKHKKEGRVCKIEWKIMNRQEQMTRERLFHLYRNVCFKRVDM